MATNLKAQAAARVYLDMRGFKILEQNWTLSRHKIDIIASKAGHIYFINLRLHPAGQISDQPDISQSSLDKRDRAAEAWLGETKWTGPREFASIELSGPSYSVIGFSETD